MVLLNDFDLDQNRQAAQGFLRGAVPRYPARASLRWLRAAHSRIYRVDPDLVVIVNRPVDTALHAGLARRKQDSRWNTAFLSVGRRLMNSSDTICPSDQSSRGRMVRLAQFRRPGKPRKFGRVHICHMLVDERGRKSFAKVDYGSRIVLLDMGVHSWLCSAGPTSEAFRWAQQDIDEEQPSTVTHVDGAKIRASSVVDRGPMHPTRSYRKLQYAWTACRWFRRRLLANDSSEFCITHHRPLKGIIAVSMKPDDRATGPTGRRARYRANYR